MRSWKWTYCPPVGSKVADNNAPGGHTGVTLLTNQEERQFQNREDILQLLVSEKLLPKSNGDKRKPMKHLPTQTCIF